MPIAIAGSLSANVLNTLHRNTSRLAKDLKKLSGGMKMGDASDGASEYAISERMRVQIRALDQDVQNTKTGRNMISVAMGGMQNILDTLRELKALAIDAANDSNSDMDRAIMERELRQRMEHINDISATTNYNGKILLDGRYKPPLLEPARPTGEVHYVPSGDIVIDQDGIYELESDYSGNIIIEAQNVELRQKDPWTGKAVHDAYIYCASAEANLWLNSMYIANVAGKYLGEDSEGKAIIDTIEKNTIKFNGTGNTLHIIGEVDIEALNAAHKAAIHVGEGLTIYEVDDGLGPGYHYLKSSYLMVEKGITCREEYAAVLGAGDGWNVYGVTDGGATIGTDYGEDDSDAYIVIDMGINGAINSITWGGGAAIGSGASASIGSIRIESGDDIGGQSFLPNTTSENWESGAGIGSGARGTVRGDIIINGGLVSPVTETGGAALGAGKYGTVQGSIIINDGWVDALANEDVVSILECQCGAAIGTGSYNADGTSSVGGIYINGGKIHADSTNAEAIGRGCLYLNPGAITAGEVGEISVDGGTYSGAFGTGSYHTYERERQDSDHAAHAPYETPLIFQTGTKAGQQMRCFIKAMDTASVGLKDTCLHTREKAELSISLLECATKYVATEIATMGAYISRLETTESNLVLSAENTQSSESTIRDADMAAEMAAYARDSLLSQAAQAMLAQANQNTSQVLSLLQ